MTSEEIAEHIQDFIRHFLSTVTAASLYGMSHPQVTRLSGITFKTLSKTLSRVNELSLLEIDGELIINREPQPFSLVLEKFARVMQQKKLGHLRFTAGVEPIELKLLISDLALSKESNDSFSSEHIKLGSMEVNLGSSENDFLEAGYNENQIVTIEDISSIELDRLADVYNAIKRNERLKPSGIAKTVAELASIFEREGESILILAALREKDEYTFSHATNVCILTMAQAISLGIEGQALHDIGIAAILHDIGKMFIPEDILLKPDRLTPEEFAQMKMHPVKGCRYLLETPGIPKLAAIVAYEHHMNYDLTGYPAVPKGWTINIASQLTAISDMFDAMRSRRPYKEPWNTADIANLLSSKNSREFNTLLVSNFLNIIDRAGIS